MNDAVSDIEHRYDVSVNRQKAVMKIINEDIKNIIKLCKEHSKEVPTEIKLIYDVQKNSLIAEHKYELVYSNDLLKTADNIAEEWFREIKNKTIFMK